jgi:hypothetical protein
MHVDDEASALAKTARVYRRFAESEARGRSPLYEALAGHIAEDVETLRFLLTLPKEKRQPNLLLATMRCLFGTPADWRGFRRRLADDHDAVRRLMLERSTQTNEPGRCATLLPVLARLPQPLALIEVGASAGLCLLPDCYGYDYGKGRILPGSTGASAPVFPCAADPGTPLPAIVPQITWRAGLDLHPLVVSEPQHKAWLEALVWPEQTERLERLRAAIEIAETTKPRMAKGDLRRDLAGLAAQAPPDVTLVIFHTAVLSYITSSTDRQAFARQASQLANYWIANERPTVFPDISRRAGPTREGFLLSVNGEPTAWTDPHGASLAWIANRTRSG